MSTTAISAKGIDACETLLRHEILSIATLRTVLKNASRLPSEEPLQKIRKSHRKSTRHLRKHFSLIKKTSVSRAQRWTSLPRELGAEDSVFSDLTILTVLKRPKKAGLKLQRL